MSAEIDCLRRIVAVLKKRFNNLSAEELIDLAGQILDALPGQEEADD